jgi:hypothetical protein
MTQAAEASDDRGLILGRYRALRPLGSGGSGTVWLARDEHDGRDVALKVVRSEGKAGIRAEREADAVARMRHRNCAKVYAVDRDDGHVYVAYEYIPGCTLREAIRTGLLDDRAAVEAAAQVLEALAHAHGKGIVHRDVKPANVIVVEGSNVSVRLLDFGLALIDDADSLTATGDVPGTLAYIAPERLAGHEASGAADVWGVGVILWEALAGTQPFWNASPTETMRLIAEGPPSLLTARPDLPRAVIRAVDSALQLDPGTRPRPKRLAEDLRDAMREPARRRADRAAVSRTVVLQRAGHAACVAAFVSVSSALLSFYPGPLAAALAVVAALMAFARPWAGLAAALAIPVLPLGDVSLGLAVIYVPLALAWLVVFRRDARDGALAMAGPLLGLISLLPLLPILLMNVRGAAQRAVLAGTAVVLGALVSGLRGTNLPFDGAPAPLGLGIAGSESPGAVASTLVETLSTHSVVAVEAVLLAATAAALPYLAGRGLWAIAGIGAVLLSVGLLLPFAFGSTAPSAGPFVLAVWVLCAGLLLRDRTWMIDPAGLETVESARVVR